MLDPGADVRKIKHELQTCRKGSRASLNMLRYVEGSTQVDSQQNYGIDSAEYSLDKSPKSPNNSSSIFD